MAGAVLLDPAMLIQLGITATATAGQLVVAKKQAELQRLSAEAQSLATLHGAEMQWFELMQGVVNKDAQAAFEALNIDINEQSKEYIQKFTELNANIALTEAEALGVLADVNVSNIRKDKWRTMRNATLKLGDINREGEAKASELVAVAASSNLAINGASNDAAVNSLGAEVDRTAARSIIEAGDTIAALGIQERQEEISGIRARALGRINVEGIRKAGAEGEFEIEQRIIGSEASISALKSESKNLRLTAELVKSSGVASANAAIAAGNVAAKGTMLSGQFDAFNTAASGMSNTYQTYLLKQQINAQPAPTTQI